jgi:hypothetical protein
VILQTELLTSALHVLWPHANLSNVFASSTTSRTSSTNLLYCTLNQSTIHPHCAAIMVKSQGVEAYLACYEDKHRYPEHEPLPAENGVLHPSTMAYAEVITGQRYEIVVMLTADFNFEGLPDVRVLWCLDKKRGQMFFTSRHVQESIQSEGQYKLGLQHVPSLVDGKWMRCELSFADLQLGMSLLAVF